MSAPRRAGSEAPTVVLTSADHPLPERPCANDPVGNDAGPYPGTVSRKRATLAMYPGRSTK